VWQRHQLHLEAVVMQRRAPEASGFKPMHEV
jgi:hypothetical protein